MKIKKAVLAEKMSYCATLKATITQPVQIKNVIIIN